ncbi:tellurite resistance protein TerC [Elusimicrobium simillimum]|uniref:TerC family protein n=1 Tax=Elusimicrobium simillimum TaxID=3143438 RepID=UPI003C6FA778
MTIHTIMWIAFWVIVAVALFVDLAIMNKHHGKVTIKEALTMVSCWVGLALLFGLAIFLTLGHGKGLEYLTGYVVEYSLSIDNMFVFIMIFTYFAIPPENQPTVLLWGILGAVAMRFLFIFLGVKIITAFWPTMILFGGILIFTAVKMVVKQDEEFDPGKNIAYRALKKIIPLKEHYSGNNFFTRENGKLFATPLLAAVVVVEMSDLVFAIDSIPAVLSITQDTFIVYTSNIFAIIGLRSLYFLLSGMAGKFPYLKYGIAIILGFVGIKMIIAHWVHVPTVLSLAVIVSVLVMSILANKIWPPKEEAK